MASDDFERRLDRLFAETPAYSDAALFAAEVQARLDRSELLRRGLISVVGGIGALIATAQLLSANLGGRLAEASTASGRAVDASLAALTRDASGLMAAAPVQTEMLYAVAGLGALALAFLATRMVDTF